MADERLLGDAGLAAVNTATDPILVTRMLGWTWRTNTTGQVVKAGYVRILNGQTDFIAGTKWQLWTAAGTRLQNIEIGGGVVSGASGARVAVPGVAQTALTSGTDMFVTIFHPALQVGNYWFQSGFGNITIPPRTKISGECIFRNGGTVDQAPNDSTFTNGAFAVDVEIGDASTSASPNAGLASGTGASNAATTAVASHAGVASGAGVANQVGTAVVTNASSAVGTGAALGATAAAAKDATAGLAAGSGDANGVAGNVAVSPATALGVGAALDPTTDEEGDVHLYKFGPCESWEPIWNRCIDDITGAAEVTGVAVQAASEILYQLTAQRFGLCSVKLRPCRQSCFPNFPWHEWWQYGTYPQPYWWNGTWYNLACGSCPNNSCSCTSLDQVILDGPVVEITEVKLNGVVLTKNVDYRLDDYRKLVRLGGNLWPFCQDMQLDDDQDNTWSVTADYGEVVPVLGRMAVGELGMEIVKYLLCDDSCALPNGAVDVSRQGISMTIANISDLFNTGFIQLRMCDLFIKTANPHHNMARSAVFDLDGPQSRAWGTGL